MASDVPVIVAQAFKNRLRRLLHILRTRFGLIIYLIKVIEFQKRGLPHAHIIIKVHSISYYTVAQKTVPMFGHFVMFGL